MYGVYFTNITVLYTGLKGSQLAIYGYSYNERSSLLQSFVFILKIFLLSVATVNNYGEETEVLFQNRKRNLQLLY